MTNNPLLKHVYSVWGYFHLAAVLFDAFMGNTAVNSKCHYPFQNVITRCNLLIKQLLVLYIQNNPVTTIILLYANAKFVFQEVISQICSPTLFNKV